MGFNNDYNHEGLNKSEFSHICFINTWTVVYLAAQIEPEIIIYNIASPQNIERLIDDNDHILQVASPKAETEI